MTFRRRHARSVRDVTLGNVGEGSIPSTVVSRMPFQEVCCVWFLFVSQPRSLVLARFFVCKLIVSSTRLLDGWSLFLIFLNSPSHFGEDICCSLSTQRLKAQSHMQRHRPSERAPLESSPREFLPHTNSSPTYFPLPGLIASVIQKAIQKFEVTLARFCTPLDLCLPSPGMSCPNLLSGMQSCMSGARLGSALC